MGAPATDVAHRTHGRVRVKVRHGKRDPEHLREVAERMGSIPGVERVETNPITGSVVLYYDVDRHSEFDWHFERHREQMEPPPTQRAPETEFDKIASTIENEAEFLAEHSVAARAMFDFCKRVDREIKVASGNNVDLKLLFAGGVVAFTVLEVGATAATPVWVTLSLFAMNHFVELHQHPVAPAAARVRAI
jgi:Heavy metal associated domain 2